MDNEKIRIEPSRKELNSVIRNFQDSVVLNSDKEPILDILSLVDSPFREHPSNDLLSAYFHRIYKNTAIPPALTIFTLLGFLSYWCVKQDITYLRPDDYKAQNMNLWLMLLAPQGTSKTISFNIVQDNMANEDREELEPNFYAGAGSAAFFQNLVNVKDGKVFWVKDEASQFIRQMENPASDLSNCKGYALESYDGKSLTRSTKKDGEQKTHKITMVQIFINTIASMLKHISEESMYDGYMRRQGIVIVRRDINQDFTDHSLYKLSKVVCEELAEKQSEVFGQLHLNGTEYTFDKESEVLFKTMFKTFWKQQYEALLHGEEGEAIYSTNMHLAWKYAVLHHILHIKSGSVIEADSMEWALKVCMYHLNSFKVFIKEKSESKRNTSIKIDTNRLERMWQFVKENGNKSSITLRAVCRKFNMTKEEVVRSLMSLKVANPKAEYDILVLAQKESNKIEKKEKTNSLTIKGE